VEKITVFRIKWRKNFPKTFQELSNPCLVHCLYFAIEISEKQKLIKTKVQN